MSLERTTHLPIGVSREMPLTMIQHRLHDAISIMSGAKIVAKLMSKNSPRAESPKTCIIPSSAESADPCHAPAKFLGKVVVVCGRIGSIARREFTKRGTFSATGTCLYAITSCSNCDPRVELSLETLRSLGDQTLDSAPSISIWVRAGVLVDVDDRLVCLG